MGLAERPQDRFSDIQYLRPEVGIPLARVGIRGLKCSIWVRGKDGALQLFPAVEVYIDIPDDMRGAHLSRSPESLYEILEEQTGIEYTCLEDFCESIAAKLLERHEYASKAEVKLRSDYVVVRKPPLARSRTYEPCEIMAMANSVRLRDGGIRTRRAIGARTAGITSCPCAQYTLLSKAIEELEATGACAGDVREALSKVPVATHTQRTFGTLIIEVPEGYAASVEDLIEVVEASMSERTYAILKRAAEAEIIRRAVANTKFVEDVVRGMLKGVVERFSDFPDAASIYAKAVSLESIHKHDVVAEIATTFGAVRRSIQPP